MTFADGIACAGVSLLLAAFAANLFGFVDHRSRVYHGLNLAGAGLACYASALIPFFPFVVLEGAWALVAVIGLLRSVPSAPPAIR